MYFRSDIRLGEEYEDTITGFVGKATDISFNVMKCNRVYIMPKVDKEGKMGDGAWFDAPSLRHVESGEMLEDGTITHDPETPPQGKSRPGGPISRIR